MNNAQKYQRYSPEDFDKFDCLKLSKVIWLAIIFVLRAYIVWLMSVTNMKDRTSVIQWVYPDPSFFYLSLLSGVFALWALLLISLRRPDANAWVKKQWQYTRVILLFALLFDFSVNVVGYFYWHLYTPVWLLIYVLIFVVLSWQLINSVRVQINLDEFPEKLPE